LKIASVSGKLISVVGVLTILQALYKGFHAQSLAEKALGITEASEFVRRDQFALADNIKVISFL